MNCIKLKHYEHFVKITFSKPPLNIFNLEDLIYIEKILLDLKNDKNLKLIVFESDQKIFSAGVDVADHLPQKVGLMMSAFTNLFTSMLNLEIPTLALVKSACFGGGSEFAMFCDFVIASENATFAQPEIKLGCSPPLSLAHISYITGSKKALEMLITGENISAKEALNLGLINYVFSEEEFDAKTEEFINSITSKSASLIKATLKTYKKLHYQGLKEKIETTAKIFAEDLPMLDDYHEGINSFFEKRPPVWTNC